MPDKFEKNSPARAGGLCESRIDALVEELAAAPAIAWGADFAYIKIGAAKSACARDDALVDALLKAAPCGSARISTAGRSSRAGMR